MVLADSTKPGTCSSVIFTGLESVDILITDSRVSEHLPALLERHDSTVTVV